MKLSRLALLAVLLFSTPLFAAKKPQFKISFENLRVVPVETVIPANIKVQLIVSNKDKGVEEFHSDSLHREKIIGGGKTAIINIGPLKPGTYTFMGEFHAKTSQGRIVVK